MQKHQPPKVAVHLIKAVLPAGDQEVVLGDFEEIYHQGLKERGSMAAWRAYWIEALRSVPLLALRKLRRPQDWLVLTSGQVLLRPSWKTGLTSFIAMMPILVHLIPWWIVVFFRSGAYLDPGIGYDLLLKPLIYDYDLGHLILNLRITLGGVGIAILLNLLGLVSFRLREAEGRSKLHLRYQRHLLPLLLIGFMLILTTPWLRYVIWMNTR